MSAPAGPSPLVEQRTSPEESDEWAAGVRFDVPYSARIWNYWLGGKDNYPIDRAAGDSVIEVYPRIVVLASQARQFLVRVVRHLAGEAGVTQFLDIGSGLPTALNTHEVAQGIAPDARVVYVDNDPLVLAHGRALLTNTTPNGVTAHVRADCRNPDAILAQAREVLDFDRPIAVLLMGVLGYVADFQRALDSVSRLMDAVPHGSHLAIWDAVLTSEGIVDAGIAYAQTGAVPYIVRGPERVARCFEGLDLLDPGFVSLPQWRPDLAELGAPMHLDAYGGVAQK